MPSTSGIVPYPAAVVWTGVVSAGETTTVTIHGRVWTQVGQPESLIAHLDVDDGINPVIWQETLVTELNPYNVFLPVVTRNY